MGARWVVAVNPAAGRRPVDPARVTAALAAAGVEGDVEVASSKESMRSIVAAASVAERLAVVGGDGTVNLAVNVLFDQDQERLPILGVLPAGTGCDLLRTFGIPQVMEEAAHHLAGDSTYDVDVGELTGDFGVRRFVNLAEAGVGAAAVETATRLPRGLGTRRYIAAFGLRLPGFRSTEVEVITERREHRGPALAVIIANGQFFAGGWNIAPKAMLVDGELDIQILDVAKTAAPALIPKLMRGLHLGEPGVRRISAPWFRLDTREPWPVEVDGDPIGNTPLSGRVHRGAIRLKI